MPSHFAQVIAQLGFVVAGLAIATPAQTHNAFPDRPIRIVVPLAPGGGGDIVARLLGSRLQPILGQPVVIENRPGGATVIGSEFAARSVPDGYTLLMATSSHVINGSLIKLPFDPVTDFAGVSLVGTTPLILVVNATMPVKSLPELLAVAKSKPQGLTYASSGIGSLPHLCGELMSRMADVKLLHVPYKGSGPAETDLLGGQVDMYFASPSSVAAHVKSGKLKALAVTGTSRLASFPDVPTVADYFPGFNVGSFYAILAPAGTLPAVLVRLNAAIKQAVEAPDVNERLTTMGVTVVLSSPSDAMKYIDTQTRLWRKVVNDANIKAE